jgi:hypothetical protein
VNWRILLLAVSLGAIGCSAAIRSDNEEASGSRANPLAMIEHASGERPEYGPVTAALGALG